jgi:type II secretory pathway component PulK
MTGTMRLRSARPGVALLTVLMTLVLIAALAAAGDASTSAATAGLTRQLHITRARWSAEGCFARSLALVNERMQRSDGSIWASLDSAMANGAGASSATGCRVAFDPVGRVLGLSQHDSVSLTRLFKAAGIRAPRCDSLVAAILDWTDADDIARAAGAESDWYRSANRATPGNSRVWNLDELRLVRGLDGASIVDDTLRPLLGVDSVRLSLRHASLPVLQSLPGVTDAMARELDRNLSDASYAMMRLQTEVGLSLSGVIGEAPEVWDVVVRAQVDEGHERDLVMRYRIGRARVRVGVLDVSEAR